VCGEPLDPALTQAGIDTHPNCDEPDDNEFPF